MKLEGDFIWRNHDNDLFLIVSSRFTIQVHEGDVVLSACELYVVPLSGKHYPRADIDTAALCWDQQQRVINTVMPTASSPPRSKRDPADQSAA